MPDVAEKVIRGLSKEEKQQVVEAARHGIFLETGQYDSPEARKLKTPADVLRLRGEDGLKKAMNTAGVIRDLTVDPDAAPAQTQTDVAPRNGRKLVRGDGDQADSTRAGNARLEGEKLPGSVPEENLQLVHYSGLLGSEKIVEPSFLGKGAATGNDTKGLPGSFWFVDGSPLKSDYERVAQGRDKYTAEVSGNRIYNSNAGHDSLNFWGPVNRAKADQMLIDKGFAGWTVVTPDGREVVKTFEPVPVFPHGKHTDKKNARFMPEAATATRQTDTPEFKKWFGESKVTDTEGEPRVVYHGTSSNFNSFNPKKATQGIFWFTSDRGAIDAGEVGAQGKGRVMDLFAQLKNPAGWDEYGKMSLGELRRDGYDGAILPDSDGTITGFVFEPEQLKSASKNRGTFDGANKDVRFMAEPATLDDFTPAKLPDVLSKKNWAIMTAENRDAKKQTPAENAAQNALLEADLTARGLTFKKVVGKYGNEENSYLITGIRPDETLDLTKQYGQESALTPEGFLYQDGTVNPAKGVTVHATEPADFYTRIPGEKTFFSVDLDFDTRRQSADLAPSTSALRILYGDSGLKAPAGGQNKGDVAKQLQEAAIAFHGEKITSDSITPEQEKGLVVNATHEVVAALDHSDQHAGNWYTVAVEDALSAAAAVYPELENDVKAKALGFTDAKGAKLGLAVAMAITSQNLTVPQNTTHTAEQYEILRKTGRFDPSIEYGTKAPAITKNLELANTMLDKMGWEGLDQFLKKDFTAGDLSKVISEMTGRKIAIAGRTQDIVQGAAIFGPKIGQGFLQNLRGNYWPVTVDLWMRRTWGRWTGDVLGDGITAPRLGNLIDASRKAGIDLPDSLRGLRVVDREGQYKRTLADETADRLENDHAAHQEINDFCRGLSKDWQGMYKAIRGNITPEQAALFRAGKLDLEGLSKQLVRAKAVTEAKWDRLKERPKGKGAKEAFFAAADLAAGRTEKLANPEISAAKPAWAATAEVVLKQLNPVDAPSDLDRAVISRIINKVRENLEARGLKTTNADIQAILWYPEKDLWAKLRGKKESNLKNSYDQEFLKLADQRGVGQEARRAVERNRAARDRLAADQGADGRAGRPADEAAQSGPALAGETLAPVVPMPGALEGSAATARPQALAGAKL